MMNEKTLSEILGEIPKFNCPAYKIAEPITYKTAEIVPIYGSMSNKGHYVAYIPNKE